MRNGRPAAPQGMCQDPQGGERGPVLEPWPRRGGWLPAALCMACPSLLGLTDVCIPLGCWPLIPCPAWQRGPACAPSPPAQPPPSLPAGSFCLRSLPPLPIFSPSPFPAPGHLWVPSPATAGPEDSPPTAASPPSPSPSSHLLHPAEVGVEAGKDGAGEECGVGLGVK